MKVTYLGQAGLLFQTQSCNVMIDPYLSNSVAKINPLNDRRVPVDPSFFDIRPDVLIITHDHLDHYDPETAPRFLEKQDKAMTVLCPTSVWQKARKCGGGHNYVEFNRYTEWTEGDLRFSAVKASHSDAYAIGVLIEDLTEKKTYYVTGDTLYSSEIFADIPRGVSILFLPINGVGNNMNALDAERFAEKVGAERVVPFHVGMFDEKTPDSFTAENRLVLEVYKETEV